MIFWKGSATMQHSNKDLLLLIPSICKEQQGGMSECGATAGIGCVFWCNYRPVDQPLWWRWTLYVLYSSLYLIWLASTRISLKWWKTSSRSKRYKERVYNRQSQLNEERLRKVSLCLVFLFWSQFKSGNFHNPQEPATRAWRLLVQRFSGSWKPKRELPKKQADWTIPEPALIHDGVTRSGSTFEMQQQAICGGLAEDKHISCLKTLTSLPWCE